MSLLLQPKYCPSTSCDFITAPDLTGQYSSLNQGGFGTPNIAVSDVTTATISVAKRGSDGVFSDNVIIDVFPDLPSDSGLSFDITTELYPDGFGDGIYRFIYTITGVSNSTPFTYSSTIYRPITCSIDSCWSELSLMMVTCPTTELKDKHERVSTMMRALKASSTDCGNLGNTQTIIDEITNLCNQAVCGCGC